MISIPIVFTINRLHMRNSATIAITIKDLNVSARIKKLDNSIERDESNSVDMSDCIEMMLAGFKPGEYCLITIESKNGAVSEQTAAQTITQLIGKPIIIAS